GTRRQIPATPAYFRVALSIWCCRPQGPRPWGKLARLPYSWVWVFLSLGAGHLRLGRPALRFLGVRRAQTQCHHRQRRQQARDDDPAPMGTAGRFISLALAGRLVRLPGWGVAMLADLVSHDPYSPYGSSFAPVAYKICVQKVKRELSSGNRFRLHRADINFSAGGPPAEGSLIRWICILKEY